MKITRHITLSLFAIIILCGFSSRFIVKVLQRPEQPPLFELTAASESTNSLIIQINSFLVVKKDDVGDWDYKHPIWSFKLTPGAGKGLSKIVYGQVPEGFTETSKAAKLSIGENYLALGFGMGSNGSTQFTAR